MRRPAADVLVVDDEAVVGEAARRILESEGLSVDVAREAPAAIERASSRDYGVVLCDLKMPGVHGLQLVDRLRALAADTPLVTITGYATLDNAIEGFAHGVFDFIPKPFDVGELLGVVRRALGCARGAPSAVEDWLAAGGAGSGAAYFLGAHAWVVLDGTGRARVGMGRAFGGLTEPLDAVELPAAGEELLQGGRCVRLVTRSELVHRLWSPLSGRVVETNEPALAGAGLRAPGAICKSWLLTMLPAHPELELSRLARRETAGAERG